ncbi:hypothetical protein GFC01_11325 [Desulfofundulus thermobenzoicus]|uniref:Uncharacterized protein n=1 Tax=Desulfofundulus thermobenzoicus TaxID=29376 RepID=A0A6N7IUP0_9FIRM|nr:hypothetical protein [Desulfofundulus thermobenzoicus]MQL52838.1 hypothetical protein [Desulfofundulus thermobenzoicus]HHW43208.1 hypothetical protein [Desulfotomaculum sp.]
MNKWLERINRLLHPHRARQEKLMSRMTEYRELSSLAMEIGDRTTYAMLQREMNEMFCEYLAWCFLDGIGFLIPHALFMWLLSLKFRVISLPAIGSEVNIIIWYPLLAIMFYLLRWRWRKRQTRTPGMITG